VARIGGDEFVLIVGQAKDRAAAEMVCEKLVKVIARIKEWHRQGVLDAHIVLNLTHAEFINRKLAQHILDAIADSGCNRQIARWLELEAP